MTAKTLYFDNPRQLNQLYCARDSNLSKVEEVLSVNIVTRENWLRVSGDQEDVLKTELLFNMLAEGRAQGMVMQDSDFENILILQVILVFIISHYSWKLIENIGQS